MPTNDGAGFDRTIYSDDPNDPLAKAASKAYLKIIRHIHIETDVTSFMLNATIGKRVLDVGMVAHTASYVAAPGWRHQQIRTSASYCLGIDILADLVATLAAQGYNVKCVDATSNVDLGELFDIIFIGDVIEHVDNPVALLRFAKRHLARNGRALVTTPNPFSRKFFRRFMADGLSVVNLDHIAWITPSMALELGRRAGFPLRSYHLIKPIPQWKKSVKKFGWRFFSPPDYTFPDYVFEFGPSIE